MAAKAKGKGKKGMSTENKVIFGVLGLMVIGIIYMNVKGISDKDIGLGGGDLN